MRQGFVEQELAELAAGQHGVVARRQLLARGLTASAIGRRVAAGRLHPVHTGVYAVGHPLLSHSGRWMAAVLAGGPGAALGYGSAAAVWDLRRGVPAVIEVVVASAGGRARAGLRIHRHPGLTGAALTTARGIPVTTPARTLLDYAAIATDRELEYALDRAEAQQLTDYPPSMPSPESIPGTADPAASGAPSAPPKRERPAPAATASRRSWCCASATACRARSSTSRSAA